MSSRRPGKSVSRIKTGSFERRLSLTRAGLFAGTRVASHMATNWFSSKETRDERHRAMLSKQARLLVDELGQLKGSVVKIGQVMASTYEHGHSVNSDLVRDLSLARRSDLGKAALELFFQELFVWGEIQTDPNFGNYRIRIAGEDGEGVEYDRIVLLDFGAVQIYSREFLDPVIQMIQASYEDDLDAVIDGGVKLRFMSRDWPKEVLETFGKVCMSVLEPLSSDHESWPDYAVNDKGQYRWKQSDLPSRVARQAARSAISRYFRVPPSEFVFLNRKLIGVYTFIAVLYSEFNGEPLLRKYLYDEMPDASATSQITKA